METSSNDGETWTELWSRSGNQGEGWLNSRVTLQTTDTTTLRFVGTTAGDKRSGILADRSRGAAVDAATAKPPLKLKKIKNKIFGRF